MNTKHNELPEVNQYIKKHKLTPSLVETLVGSCYNKSDDITHLVVEKDNTYVSYGDYDMARLDANKHKDLLVVCRGKING